MVFFLIAGGLYFYLQNIKPPEVFILDKDGFYKILSDLNNLSELEIEANSTSDYSGCIMTATYFGKIDGTSQYAKTENKYKNEQVDCYDLGVMEGYYETYWFKDKIYNRQYEHHNFVELSPESRQVIAPKPEEFIQEISFTPEESEINSIEDIGKSIKVIVNHKKEISFGETIAGEFTYFIDKETQKITKYSFKLDSVFKEKRASVDVSGILRYSVSPIKLPTLSDVSFLLSSFDDIFNYDSIYYKVDTEHYLFYTDNNFPQIYLLTGERPNFKAVNCYLFKPVCQEKLKELRGHFSEIREMIKNSEENFCSDERGETGYREVIYKDRLVLKMSNRNRNPRETADYTLKVDFTTTGENKGSYHVYLRMGKMYCYNGMVDEKTFDAFAEKFNDYADSIYEVGYKR